MLCTKNYQRLYLPFILNETNTLSVADIGVTYSVSFWAMSSKAGSFQVRMSDGKTRPGNGISAKTYRVADADVNQWIRYEYTFTISQEMIDASATHLSFAPSGFSQTPEDTVSFYIDDLNVTRDVDMDCKLLAPVETAAAGVGGSTPLSVLADPTVPEPGIHKAYFTFRLPDDALRAATLKLTLSQANGTISVYALPIDTLPDPLTYANAPASLLNEGVDPAEVFGGEALYTGEAVNGVLEAPASAYIQSVTGQAVFVAVSDDAVTPMELSDLSLTLYTATENPVSLLPGASIRTAEPSGLRFESALDKNLYEQLVAAYDKVVFGTYIFPADRYEEFAAADMAGALRSEFRDVAGFEERDGVYTYYTSIVELKDQNYARAFGAVSYITVTKDGESRTMTTHYDPALNARSIRDVAAQVAGSGELASMDEAQQTVVRGYLDAVVEVNADGTAVVPDGCTSPYTVRISDGKLIITAAAGGDVGNIRSVIYNDTVYTGGWSIADGEWSAPLG